MTKTDLTQSTAALELVTVSFKIYQCHKDLIDRAAALVEGRTASDYFRDVMPMQAALDLGVELPKTPDINRGRSGGLIAQAAAKLGLSKEDFESHAAKLLAAQTLGADAIENRPSSVPPPKSASRPAVRPGAYSVRPAKASR